VNRLLFVVAAVLVLVAAGIAISRVAGLTLPWEAASCGNPNAVCWTRGKPTYIAVIRREVGYRSAGDAAAWVLNTGPDIPNLVAELVPNGQGTVNSIRVTLNTGSGPRPVRARRIPAKRGTYAWSMGRVPDGAVAAIFTKTTPRGHDVTWTQVQLYAHLNANGLPSESDALLYDHAQIRG
jgi:hypothetical protein